MVNDDEHTLHKHKRLDHNRHEMETDGLYISMFMVILVW